jgi:hypothetical protein
VPVAWEAKGDLLHLVLVGEYTFGEIASVFEAGLASVRPQRLRVLWDGSEASSIPDAGGVRQRIDLLHKHKGRCAQIAIVGRSGVMFGLARQVAQTLDCDDTAVDAFWDVGDARSWLSRRGSPVSPKA